MSKFLPYTVFCAWLILLCLSSRSIHAVACVRASSKSLIIFYLSCGWTSSSEHRRDWIPLQTSRTTQSPASLRQNPCELHEGSPRSSSVIAGEEPCAQVGKGSCHASLVSMSYIHKIRAPNKTETTQAGVGIRVRKAPRCPVFENLVPS